MTQICKLKMVLIGLFDPCKSVSSVLSVVRVGFLCTARITKVTRLYMPGYGILMCMKTKNMRELEKMWAKKASEQSNPQKKGGAPTRQPVSHAPRISRKSNRGS